MVSEPEKITEAMKGALSMSAHWFGYSIGSCLQVDTGQQDIMAILTDKPQSSKYSPHCSRAHGSFPALHIASWAMVKHSIATVPPDRGGISPSQTAEG